MHKPAYETAMEHLEKCSKRLLAWVGLDSVLRLFAAEMTMAPRHLSTLKVMI